MLGLMTLPNSSCEKCKLYIGCASPFMAPEGPEHPAVMVIGEAPGADEDSQGRPFVGRSGRLLRQALTGAGFDIHDVLFSNMVRCRPPDNKISKLAIDCCTNNIRQEIEAYDPKLVLLMGNSPLALIEERGITQWNGVTVRRDGRVYVPLYHPAYILRNAGAMDDWINGFLSAADVLGGNEQEEPDDMPYRFPKTIRDLEQMRGHLEKHYIISYDIETTTLTPHSPQNGYEPCIISVAFGCEDACYSFPIDHPESWWTDDEYDEVISIIEDILVRQEHKIVNHNIKFDQHYTLVLFDIDFQAGGDTMLLSHLLDSRRGIHSLKRLAGLYVGMYKYDDELEAYKKLHSEANPYAGGTYAAIPLEILLPYGAMDAHAVIRLYDRLYNEISNKQRILHDELIVPASDALMRIEYAGAPLDPYIIDRYVKVYSIIQQDSFNALLDDPTVQRLIQDEQEALDDSVMADMVVNVPANVDVRVEDFQISGDSITYVGEATLGGKSKRRMRKCYEFNPNSDFHVRKLLFDRMDVPIEGKTDTGLASTKYGLIRPHEEEFPIIRHIRMYKLMGKMLSTYLLPAQRGSWGMRDRARSSYNLHGSRTGRLSSTDPNLQNIPTPEKEPGTVLEMLPVKNIFTHTHEGGCVMSVDYSGMELRVFASLAKCEPMLEIHRSGEDFHTMVASMISGIPKDKIDKSTRYIYKWTNWTLLYGGSEYTLHSMYDIPLSEAEAAVKKYYRRFPEVPEFLETCTKFAIKHGYIESPFGRREHLPYINSNDHGKSAKARRSAVNMPVQSAASDTLLIALVIIDKFILERGLRTTISNTVHDSIMFDIYPGEVDIIAEASVDIMENISKHAAVHMPGIDFSWLISPLKADVEIGSHYGSLSKYGG